QRKEIMIAFHYEEKAIGVTYYILNIIKALNHLPDPEKPNLTIFHNASSPMDEVKKIGYPYLTFLSFTQNLSLVQKVINRISFQLTGSLVYKVQIPRKRVRNFYP